MRYNLNVDFYEKDQAKRLGAKWDFTQKVWYYETDGDIPEDFARWNPQPVGGVADPDDPYRDYKTVTEISAMIGEQFRSVPAFQNVLVKGEVIEYSGLPFHGYYYFQIKDSRTVLSCVIPPVSSHALRFELKNGKKVAIQGILSLQNKQTRCQLQVRTIHDLGDGEAALALARLDQELRALGYYDQELKKTIPMFPAKIGIVSSLAGDGCADMLSKAKEIDPSVQIYLFNTPVQGAQASRKIAQGIQILDRRGLDFIIVGRGGGGDESLHAFSERAVLDAVYHAQTPIISAVGHSTNQTLIDKVADSKVITPTDAVVKYFKDRSQEREKLQKQVELLQRFMMITLHNRKEALHHQIRLLQAKNPVALLQQHKQQLDQLLQSMQYHMQEAYQQRWNLYQTSVAQLDGLSPTAKLINGFGYITNDHQPVRSVEQVKVQDGIEILIHDGTIHACVTDVKMKKNTNVD